MQTFSPQKSMVYIPSGFVQESNKKEEWTPGYWIDLYPVSNSGYLSWVEYMGLEELPRHWRMKEKEESSVTPAMGGLPVVDIPYEKADAFAATLDKKLIDKTQWDRIKSQKIYGTGFLNRIKNKYLKKNRLEKNFIYYRNSLHFEIARDITQFRDLARDITQSSDLGSTHDVDRDLEHILIAARDLARDLDIERSRDLIRDLSLDIDRTRSLTGANNISLARARARALAQALEKYSRVTHIKQHFTNAQKSISIICEELKTGWSWNAWFQAFELGKALVDALVAFIELVINPISSDLLTALRQPGLLEPVDKYPPNELGIYDLIGNTWEWTSTTNEKGEHLICGGAWTEETFNPDKKEWRHPNWQDINLGFRCACDWDKIFQVKEIKDLAKEKKQEKETPLITPTPEQRN